MIVYSIFYSRSSRDQIKSLHPQIKPFVKSQIEQLKENPYLGKRLERELSGYYSLRTKRYRIVYSIEHQSHRLYIQYVGHRKDIYELFRDALERIS